MKKWKVSVSGETMPAIDPGTLDYVILSGDPTLNNVSAPYKQVFEFWQAEWSAVFSEIDPSFGLDSSEFSKQSRICALMHEGVVVGLQSLNDFSFGDILIDSYFKPYTVEFVQYLASSQVRKFQVMKFFLVGKKFSVRETGLNLAAIILGLSFLYQKHLRLDATITVARRDVAAASTAKKFNMHQIGSDIKMHNVPVGQLLCTQPAPYPRPDVTAQIEDIWRRRVEYYAFKKDHEPRSTYAELSFNV